MKGKQNTECAQKLFVLSAIGCRDPWLSTIAFFSWGWGRWLYKVLKSSVSLRWSHHVSWLEGLSCGWRKETWDHGKPWKKTMSLWVGWAERWIQRSQCEEAWSWLWACEIHLEIKRAGASLKLGHLLSLTRYPEMQILNLGEALEVQHRGWKPSSHVGEGCGLWGRDKSKWHSAEESEIWRERVVSWETKATRTCELWKQQQQMKSPEQTKLPRGTAVQSSQVLFHTSLTQPLSLAILLQKDLKDFTIG